MKTNQILGEKDKDEDISGSKKYIKKLNVKSYKIKNNNVKCFEREREQNKDKIKEKKINKKKINIYTGNNNSSGILINSSNTFLNHIRTINTPHNGSNPILNCYLSPKYNNSQVFNNFYSIICGGTVNAPVKVINVYKK